MSDIIPSAEQASRTIKLIGLLCDERITAEQLGELDQLVVQFSQIRRHYVELMSLHADLRQQAALLKPPDSTESSAITAIVDLINRQQSEAAEKRSTYPEDSTVSKADMNETLILPAIVLDSISESKEEEAAIIPAMTITPPPGQKHFPWRSVAAIAFPLLTLGIFWAFRSHSGSSPSVSLVPSPSVSPRPSITPSPGPIPSTDPGFSPSPQCIVNLAIDAKWSDPDYPAPIDGSALNLGIHDLTSGMLKLELPGNAMVVVESPARFEVLSNNKLRLFQGKLCGQLIKGGGLTVTTPDLTAVDMGTEFAMEVAAGKQTHLEVLQGAVRAATTNSTVLDAARDVVAGEAVVVSTGSTAIQKDTPRPLAFLRPSQVQAGDDTSYQRWERFSQTIREDTDLAAYYPFDAESVAANQLENGAKATAGSYSGTMGAAGVGGSNPEWTQGRWPGKSALQFGGAHLTAVTINSPHELIPKEALTLCCWIKRADLDKTVHILAGEAEGGRAFNLGFVRNEATGSANRMMLTWAQYHVYSAPADFHANQWEFVAVSSTVQSGTQFYLDGKLVSVDKSPSSVPVVVNQLVIGAPVPGNKLSNPRDYFNGLMDELLIYRRALSGEEIAQLFKMGSPD